MAHKKIKPCPCCGEDMARVINDNDFFRVRCDYCGLQTEVNYKDEEGAIDSWNMRSSNWHTGTPTEEGRYLLECGIGNSENTYYTTDYWSNSVGYWAVNRVIRWQKIKED